MHIVRLSKPLVDALQQLAALGGEARVSELQMTAPVYANFASLRYFDLIAPVYRADGTRMKGRWALSPTGREFLAGSRPVTIGCWREGGRRVAWQLEAPTLFVDEITDALSHPDPASPIWS